MALGPGKYDDICTLVREKTDAEAVVVVIINGNRGAGFSVQGHQPAVVYLPDLLDMVSKSIRKDSKA